MARDVLVVEDEPDIRPLLGRLSLRRLLLPMLGQQLGKSPR